ncbi:hypothetical protein NY2A_b180L [Paramecium bursaria Chlorella virus NY2A]|uniref:Uncharacterized protein b180L n=1 Tax=Paramecium bursaria Chlorella virus NY2A TaxID=46021 RepID=A7IW55_PBCVN|nr:hypothetical protein NY2A_b180L [Paramecium bursaria Chlorella virus NY2A]ABT14579.1 hypothetical protein NY2A_b180L [Paramecium bursaria Chlorella virus NY2A]
MNGIIYISVSRMTSNDGWMNIADYLEKNRIRKARNSTDVFETNGTSTTRRFLYIVSHQKVKRKKSR